MTQSDGLAYDPVEKAAVFSGRVTTDGGGGFASLRSDEWSGFATLTAARGIRLMVQGDGRQYKLNAKVGAGAGASPNAPASSTSSAPKIRYRGHVCRLAIHKTAVSSICMS